MSQSNQILEALGKGERMTPMDALNRFGCFRLSARIKDLRNQGYLIATEKVSENGKTFARYHLYGDAKC